MTVDEIEFLVRQIGAAAALFTLFVILAGLFSGLLRPRGQLTGHQLPIPQGLFPVGAGITYIVLAALYFGVSYYLWRPLPLILSLSMRSTVLILGMSLYFPGLALGLWGRVALGKFYDVSSSFGARLFADHQLVTKGPYVYIRHPIYVGMLIAGLGGLLLYRTWTLVFLSATSIGLVFRARREEEVLAEAFGQEWEDYVKRVPAWFPHLRR